MRIASFADTGFSWRELARRWIGPLVVILVTFCLVRIAVLNVFFTTGDMHDPGWYATIIWRNHWRLRGPPAYPEWFFNEHLAPMMWLANAGSFVFPWRKFEYYGCCLAAAHALYAAGVYRAWQLTETRMTIARILCRGPRGIGGGVQWRRRGGARLAASGIGNSRPGAMVRDRPGAAGLRDGRGLARCVSDRARRCRAARLRIADPVGQCAGMAAPRDHSGRQVDPALRVRGLVLQRAGFRDPENVCSRAAKTWSVPISATHPYNILPGHLFWIGWITFCANGAT